MKQLWLCLLVLAVVLAWMSVVAFRFIGSLDQYCGVHRSDTRQEVLYRLGSPPSVVGPPEKTEFGMGSPVYTPGSQDPKRAMPDGKKIEDFPEWTYELNADATVSVYFDGQDKVEGIECLTGHAGGCPDLAGVAFNDTEEQVMHKLGTRHVRSQLLGVAKEIQFDDLGVVIYLTKDRVYMMKLLGARPATGAVFLHYLMALPGRLIPN
ncbi:hypothetical protein [Dyella silvatica]|uniref:hypothetical protein n=1 Tax=Dyella silvatica TaxID=2992128 RepID=UPI0022533C95|nr:hypothetical protein [Dyella silvatica]